MKATTTSFRLLPRWLLGVLVLGATSTSACDETGPRIYTARAFQPDQGCLALDAPLGLVEADELPATCEPVCLALADDLYVSTVCPPYPATTLPITPATSVACTAALAALSNEQACAD